MTRIRTYSNTAADNPSPPVELKLVDLGRERPSLYDAMTAGEVATFFKWPKNGMWPNARIRNSILVYGIPRVRDVSSSYCAAVESLEVLSTFYYFYTVSREFLATSPTCKYRQQGLEAQLDVHEHGFPTDAATWQMRPEPKKHESGLEVEREPKAAEKIALPKHDRATRMAAAKRMAELWKESGNEPIDGVEYQNRMRAEWQ